MSEPDDKKFPDDEEESKIPSRRSKKVTFADNLRDSLSDFFDEISWKYVAAVAGAVTFCILVVGGMMIFANPDVSHIQKPAASTEAESPENVIEKRINIKIRDGMSTAEIAERLAEKGVIDSSLKFRFFARLRGYDDKFRPGSYTFTLSMSDDDVFAKLLTGEKKLIQFTVPEGFGVKEIAERLQNLDLADRNDFIKAAENFAPYDYMRKRQNVFFAAEGFLFPDTYNVESDMDIEEILNLMARNFDERLTPEMRTHAEKMGLSVYDLITLASLVEREVRFPEDRPIVAQVFLKRLKMNMPLQTDASLQYLMDTPKEDVTIADTEIDSPYNTYQHVGLPPGPIANPGMASIEAVLHPSETEYLYFVADRNGHNHYAFTYEEHLNLVNQYR